MSFMNTNKVDSMRLRYQRERWILTGELHHAGLEVVHCSVDLN